MRLLLINDNSAHANWGAQATPYAMCKVLRSVEPGIKIDPIPHAWLRHTYRRVRLPGARGVLYRYGSIKHVNTFLKRFSDEVEFFPAVADDFDVFADEWMEGEGGPPAEYFLKLASRADVVVYNGENSVYLNTVEGQRACFLLEITKRLGKPACAVNLTADLNTVRPILKGMVERVYPTLDLVATRERCSYQLLESLGIAGVDDSSDVVFGLDPEVESSEGFDVWRQEVGLQGPFVCVSASGLPVSKPRGSSGGAFEDLVKGLRKVVPNVVLVARDGPHQFLREVARRTDVYFFGPEHGFSELWPLFREARVLVTGHFHYAIIGSMAGCPFVPLSANNHKLQGLCRQLDWTPEIPFDVTALRLSVDKICDLVGQHDANRDELSARLASRSVELRRRVHATMGSIVAVARGDSTAHEGKPTDSSRRVEE